MPEYGMRWPVSEDVRRRQLENVCRQVGEAIAGEMNDLNSGPPMGFMLMMFDFGPPGKFMTYFSNAQREDMIKVLREQANHLENM